MKFDNDLLINLDKIHTTELGALRIKRNLKLEIEDVVNWCVQKIEQAESIIRKGKNWYVRTGGVTITVNAHSCTIITAHRTYRAGLLIGIFALQILILNSELLD